MIGRRKARLRASKWVWRWRKLRRTRRRLTLWAKRARGRRKAYRRTRRRLADAATKRLSRRRGWIVDAKATRSGSHLRRVGLPGSIGAQFKTYIHAARAAQGNRIPGIQWLGLACVQFDPVDRRAIAAAKIDHLIASTRQGLYFRVLGRNLAIGEYQAIVPASPNGKWFGSQINEAIWSSNGCTHTIPLYFIAHADSAMFFNQRRR